ncbi:MAG TPA: SUF system NifU family Fe-S cluster assembly protein [Candidatus Enterosoma merdigallinarum]|nr:SUF system NifU family Fe-S cluster assembly protein [Candidatus Enterosoma merdigallinarum]
MSFSLEDPMVLREIIVDHYKNPRNFEDVKDPGYVTVHMDSASCIDDIYIHVLVKDGVIADCKWHGKGCAISTASTSILTEMMIGKKKEEAYRLMDDFNRMLMGEEYDKDELGEAIAFINVNRQPSRITCANIGWRGMKKALEQEDKHD